MADLETLDDVKRWLKEPGHSRDQIVIFTARAALRAVPALAADLRNERRLDELSSGFALWVFCAMAAPWATANTRTRSPNYAAADAGNLASNVAPLADVIAPHAVAVADAAARAAFTAVSNNDDIAAAVGAIEAAVAASDTAAHSNYVYDLTIREASTLQDGMPIAELIENPLWLGTAPRWARALWSQLRELLLASGEDWDVWIDWYERRLAGAPLGLPLELAWLQLTDDDWKQGPAHANRRLKEEIAEFERSDAIQPPEPEPGPGPHYAIRSGKLSAFAHPPLHEEIEPQA